MFFRYIAWKHSDWPQLPLAASLAADNAPPRARRRARRAHRPKRAHAQVDVRSAFGEGLRRIISQNSISLRRLVEGRGHCTIPASLAAPRWAGRGPTPWRDRAAGGARRLPRLVDARGEERGHGHAQSQLSCNTAQLRPSPPSSEAAIALACMSFPLTMPRGALHGGRPGLVESLRDHSLEFPRRGLVPLRVLRLHPLAKSSK